MFQLALRNILRHKGRFLITLGAIVFGVMALILSGGFVADVFVQLREVTIHSQLGHIQIHKAGYTKLGRRAPYDYLLDDPAHLASELATLPHVVNVLQRLEFSGLLSKGRADLPIIGQGIEPNKETELGTFLRIAAGRHLTNDDAVGILVGQGVAGALQLSPGDFVILMVNTPDGALNSLEFEVVGVFQTFSKDFDDRAVQIPLAAAQELLVTDKAHMAVLHLDDSAHVDEVVTRIKASNPPETFDVLRWEDLADFYASTVALYQRQFGILLFIVLLMVILGVANSINMAIFERTGEFGTQRATGDRGRRIFYLIVTETAILGFIGAVLGLLIGVALAWGISRLGIPMPPPPNSNTGYTAYIRIVPSVLVLSCLVGLIASVLAALLPAWRTARVSIIDALRQNV